MIRYSNGQKMIKKTKRQRIKIDIVIDGGHFDRHRLQNIEIKNNERKKHEITSIHKLQLNSQINSEI